jgi:hypothetical protein
VTDQVIYFPVSLANYKNRLRYTNLSSALVSAKYWMSKVHYLEISNCYL